MSTTTIRISREAHQRLIELSEAADSSLTSTVEDAIEALVARRFAERTAAQLDALRAEPQAWATYVGESEMPAAHDIRG